VGLLILISLGVRGGREALLLHLPKGQQDCQGLLYFFFYFFFLKKKIALLPEGKARGFRVKGYLPQAPFFIKRSLMNNSCKKSPRGMGLLPLNPLPRRGLRELRSHKP
jgi:hypothetical protein